MIITITGPIGSGKGIAAKVLKEKGYVHHSFSAQIREVAEKKGIIVNRENLTLLGHDIASNPKEKKLSEYIIEKIKKNKEYNVVIEGVRALCDVEKLKQNPPFVLVYVDADQRIRFQRIKKRGRPGDPKTFEEFVEIDNKELHGLGGPGQELLKIKDMADFVISNNTTEEDLRRKIEEILEAIG